MRGSTEPGTVLAGRRILAVEDEYMVLLEIATVLSSVGATVVKCSTIDQALHAIDTEHFDAAILDVRVARETIAPVAHKLDGRGTPFLFYTGQVVNEANMAQWPKARIVSKPAMPTVLIGAVVQLLLSSGKSNASGQ
ncbi:MAG TPA: hypothetical protein VJS12_20865 [Steroidobacteraceae bacterium]|nr:hypothetical protein [Steroidobacteraceae bacterium]